VEWAIYMEVDLQVGLWRPEAPQTVDLSSKDLMVDSIIWHQAETGVTYASNTNSVWILFLLDFIHFFKISASTTIFYFYYISQ
jgi:hypothetical protein